MNWSIKVFKLHLVLIWFFSQSRFKKSRISFWLPGEKMLNVSNCVSLSAYLVCWMHVNYLPELRMLKKFHIKQFILNGPSSWFRDAKSFLGHMKLIFRLSSWCAEKMERVGRCYLKLNIFSHSSNNNCSIFYSS